MSSRFEIIPFHDHQILTLCEQDSTIVVMKPIVEAMGLNWRRQHTRITEHPVISKGITFAGIPSAGGAQDMLCLTLEHFHGWLLTLDTRYIKDPVQRALIEVYQSQAFRTIYEHYHGPMYSGRSQVEGGSQLAAPRIRAMREFDRAMIALAKAELPAQQRIYYARMRELAPGLGHALEPIEAYAPRHALDAEVEHFWSIVLPALDSGALYNWHRKHDRGKLALHWEDVETHCKSAGFHTNIYGEPFLAALGRYPLPRFDQKTTVNCRDKVFRHCWVFSLVPEAGQALE